MIRHLCAFVLAVAATTAQAAPQLYMDQFWGGWSSIDDPAAKGASTFFSVDGPDFGIARYHPVAGWTVIDAPAFANSNSKPAVAGNYVYFRGAPLHGDGGMRIYRVEAEGSIELASCTDWDAASEIVEVNGRAVFPFYDPDHGMELWVSDGTPEGTRLLKDIHATSGSVPTFGVVVDGFLFFAATDVAHGRELWKTDGTVAGTTLVKDIEPGADSSSPSSFAEVGGLVVFSAFDDVTGYEPRRSDGTAAGTYLIRDLVSGAGSSDPAGFRTVDGWAYFMAKAPGLGLEPHRTNGNAVQFVANVNPGGDSWPSGFYGYDGLVYFTAMDDAHGFEIWRTDGLLTGTELVHDCNPGPGSSIAAEFLEFDGALYFTARGDGVNDQLWRTQGNSATTEEILVNPVGAADLAGFFRDGAYLCFGADVGSNDGHEPRRFDPVTGSIDLMADLNPYAGSYCEQLSAYGDDLVAISDNYWWGRDLWHYDLSIPEDSRDLDDTGWRESQAPLNAKHVIDGSIVYFTGWQNETGFEVGAYDGENLYQVDVIPGPDGCDPTELVLLEDGRVFFVGRTEDDTYGLFRFLPPPNVDATLVYDFGDAQPRDLTALGGRVVFVASDPDAGEELWRSNGQQTARLADLNPGPAGSEPLSLTMLGDQLFFSAVTPSNGRELWVTDGSQAGTQLVGDLRIGTLGSDPGQLTAGGPFLYCTAYTEETGIELYRATASGVELLDEMVAGPGSANPLELAYAGSRLHFSADDGTGSGREPWSLVHEATPVLSSDLNPGPASSNPRDFASHLGAVYFTANDGTLGRELWRMSDGDLRAASDAIAPGAVSSVVGDRVSVGNRLYFVAENDEFGREMWFVEDEGGSVDVPSSPFPLRPTRLEIRTAPNPFTDQLVLELSLPRAAEVSAELVDAAGRVVDRIGFGRLDSGVHSSNWRLEHSRSIPAGVYFVRVQAGGAKTVEKVLRLR